MVGFLAAALPAAASLVGGLISAKKAGDIQDSNVAQQNAFAQHGIQWKVADAKAAGINPLAALGAPTMSYSPQQVGGPDVGTAISDMGQNLGRAVDASSTSEARSSSKVVEALTLERAKLQNDLLRSQITQINRASNPPFPSGSITGDVRYNPDENTSVRPDSPSITSNLPAPALKQFRNADGSISNWPSPEAKQAIEDSMYEYEHMWRNRIIPWIGRQMPASWFK
ncbi:MAG: DNA pilot protein [Arizlama microvirus]|nr:MAG: DNA pilot protein [Arizlama microvirus]